MKSTVLSMFIFVCIIDLSFSQKDNQSFPLFEIDLDRRPFDRWREIARHYRVEIPEIHQIIVQEIRKALPSIVIGVVETVAGQLDRFLKPEMAEEIRGFVHYSGAKLGDIVILNFMYELNAFKSGCTTILAQNRMDEVILARNLDYDWAPILRRISFIADFKKAGQTVFAGMGVPGLVGVIQGMR